MQLVPDFVENRFELAALVVFPLALVFGDRLIESGATRAAEDPLEALRECYARGGISHDEFELGAERLVETEILDASPEDDHENAADP